MRRMIAFFVASVLSGLVGVAAALFNSAALKIAGLGATTAKAKVVSAAAKAAAEAGVKAVVHQAKSKIAVAPAVAHVAPVVPVVAAPTVPVVPSVTAAQPTGWYHSMTYGYPFFGYGFARSAIELRKHSEAPLTNASLDPAVGLNPQVLKNIFEYVTSYDAERCVLRVVCEVAAQPSLAGPQGKNVAEFMTSLSKDYSGQVSADRNHCQERYPTCSQSTVTLVQMARTRIAQVESMSFWTGAATKV